MRLCSTNGTPANSLVPGHKHLPAPRTSCAKRLQWKLTTGLESGQTACNHIKIQEKSGAGGGNRTKRAYSFYVTYCKHTNARTAQPAVCPPPMYKIMYNEIGRFGVAHRLRCYEDCYEDYCICTLASSAPLGRQGGTEVMRRAKEERWTQVWTLGQLRPWRFC